MRIEKNAQSGCGSVWLERCLREAEVASSNLVTPIFLLQQFLLFFTHDYVIIVMCIFLFNRLFFGFKIIFLIDGLTAEDILFAFFRQENTFAEVL